MKEMIRQNNLLASIQKMSIRLRSDGFSLYIKDKNDDLIEFRDFLFVETDSLEVLKYIRNNYLNLQFVEILIETDFYTLVPCHLFKVEESKQYMQLQHPNLPENAMIYYMQIGVEDAMLLFDVDTSKLAIFQQFFPDAAIQHHLFPLLNSTKSIANDVVSVLIRDKSLDIIVFQHNKLKLMNSFPHQTEEDVIYHIMNVFHLLKLNYDQCNLEIIHAKQIEYHLEDFLKKYIATIRSSSLAD